MSNPTTTTDQTLRAENAGLRARLEEAEEMLRAIRAGEVDALVVEGDAGPRSFTLQGLDAEQNRVRGEMLAQVSDAVIAVDTEERVTFLNAAAEQLYRVGGAELLGRKITDLYTRQWPSPEAEAAALTALEERGHWRGEKLHRTRDGRELPVEASIALLHDPATGERFGLIVAVRDITERKEAEAALRRNTALFSQIIEQAPGGVYVVDAQFRLVQVNAEALPAFASVQPLIGRDFDEVMEIVWGPEIGPQCARVFRHTLATGERYVSPRFSEQRHDIGVEQAFEWETQRITLPDGQHGVVCYFQDVTARERAEAARRESEEQLQLAIAGSDLGTWHWDLRTGALEWSERCLKIFGLPPGTAMSYEKFLGALHPEDRARADDAVQRALQDGSEYRIEFRSVWPDGSVHWAFSQGRAYYDAAGEPTRMEGIALDITERKRAEEARRLTSERLNLAVKCSQVVLFQQDLELRYTWLQNAVPGFDDSHAVGKRDADLMERAEDAATTEALKREVLRSGVSQRQEVRVQVQGEVRHYDLLVEPLRDAAGLTSGVTGAAIDITERHRAEATLREGEHFLQRVTQVTPGVISVFDIERGRTIFVSRSVDSIIGYNPGEIVAMGSAVGTLMHPDDQPRFAQHLERVCALGDAESTDFEHRMRTKSGDWRWFQSRDAVFARDEAGKVVQLVSAAFDVTARKLAEVALAERTELLNGVLESTTDVIYVKDLDGRLLLANTAFAAAARSSPEQLVGKTDEEWFPPDVAAAVRQQDEAVIAGGSPMQFEDTLPVAGEARVFLSLKAPLRDGSGRVIGILGISRDITERKHAEAALRESEERIQQALRVSESFTFNWNAETDRVRRSASAGAILHLAGKEAVSDTALGYFQRIHPEDRERFVALVTGLRADARDYTVDYRVVRADGVVVSLEEVGRRSFDAAGKLVRIEGVATDVTRHRQAEAALREATEKAVAANAAKDRFLAALSHELRTPLTPVLLVSEMHAQSESLSEDLCEDFAMIHRNIVLEAQLIDDLLDVSRIQQGKMRFDFKLVDVHEAIVRALEMLRSEVQEKGLAVRQELHASPATVEADPARLRQVLCNLLRNAVKFTPRGGTITVRTARDPSALQISIADTGAGIAAEDLERIFQSFEQVDAQQKSEHRSLGLGLAISAAIVAAHRGRIWAESPGPGQGATLHVQLPF